MYFGMKSDKGAMVNRRMKMKYLQENESAASEYFSKKIEEVI